MALRQLIQVVFLQNLCQQFLKSGQVYQKWNKFLSYSAFCRKGVYDNIPIHRFFTLLTPGALRLPCLRVERGKALLAGLGVSEKNYNNFNVQTIPMLKIQN